MIIDAHAHVSDTDYGNADLLLKQLDEAGIDKAICVPGGMMDVRKMTRYMTGDEKPDPKIPNHVVKAAVQKHPDRLWGFVCLNPLEGERALAMLDEGIGWGAKGIKLAPMVHEFPFSGKTLAAICERAGKAGMPVYSHVVFNPGANTDKFCHLAEEFRGTHFILGHMGFGPADMDAVESAAAKDNLWLETSLGNYLVLKMALEKLGPKKLIFGSEFPMAHPKAQLGNVRLLGPAGMEDILANNILGLIGGKA